VTSSKSKSYNQILKSSFVVGSASFINIILGIVRTKFLALWLGPAGVGVLGIYNSVVQTASALGGLGIGRSGVRQIAETAGAGFMDRCARSVAATLRWSLVLGLIAGGVVLLLCVPISRFTFRHKQQAPQIGWLGLAVVATILSAGQIATIQGTRHVRFLAQQNVIGAFLGTLVSIPIVYLYGQAGVVWVVLSVSLIGLASSSFYVRKVPLVKVRLAWRDYWTEGRSLIRLGVILMMTGLLSTGTLLVVRTFLNRQMGEASTGYFQSAFSISAVYLDFILQAMAADFYPRLTAASQDHEVCNRLVNEQMEIALLLAAPLILTMLAFSQIVIYLLYSSNFGPACELLRWQMIGSLFKVAAWPIGFIPLAKNQGLKFLVCELLWNATYLGIILLGLKSYGLVIAGTGFVAAYGLLFVWTLLLGARLTGFRLNRINRTLLAVFLSACLLIVLLMRFAPPGVYYTLSIPIVLVCACWSLTKLYAFLGPEAIASMWKRFVTR
jgi:antigen flippase